MKKILLVNPWICDFAAYDLWLSPLGLLNIAALCKHPKIKIDYIDFLDRFDPDCLIRQRDNSQTAVFGTGHFFKQEIRKPKILEKIDRKFFCYGLPEKIIQKKIHALDPDLILVTSGMTYWYEGVKQTINFLKKNGKKCPLVLGGIYPSLIPEHARKCTQADIVFSGSNKQEIVNLINSLLGVKIDFKAKNFPAFNLLSNAKALPLLGSLGCPYECTYCASKKIYPEFEQFDFRNVLEQIEFMVEKYKTEDFAFYDDALLVNAEWFIKPLLRNIIKKKIKARFHTPNGLHARFIDPELAQLMSATNFKTIRLSLESTENDLQQKSNRKITNPELTTAVKLLLAAGIKKPQLGVYTLFGFPGQTIASINTDIQFVNSLGAQIHLSSYSLVPKTQEWESAVEKKIIKSDTDPLLLSHTAFPLLYAGFSDPQIRALRKYAAALNRE